MMTWSSGGDGNVCADDGTQTHVQTLIHIHTKNELLMNEFTNVHVCVHSYTYLLYRYQSGILLEKKACLTLHHIPSNSFTPHPSSWNDTYL